MTPISIWVLYFPGIGENSPQGQTNYTFIIEMGVQTIVKRISTVVEGLMSMERVTTTSDTTQTNILTRFSSHSRNGDTCKMKTVINKKFTIETYIHPLNPRTPD